MIKKNLTLCLKKKHFAKKHKDKLSGPPETATAIFDNFLL